MYCFKIAIVIDILISPTVPPTVITSPEDSEVVIGNNITLTCSASGIYLPTITWSRGGERIAGSLSEIITQSVVNESLLTSEIVIPSSEQRDTGSYSCSANNSAGVDIKLFYLQVLGMCMHFSIFIPSLLQFCYIYT